MARPKKKHFELGEYTNPSGLISWRVSGTRADGTRVRQNFPTRTLAVQAMADYEAGYAADGGVLATRRTRLSEEQLADAEAATAAATGRSLATIVSRHDALLARAAKKGVDLDTVVGFFERHYREEIREITVFNAYREFLEVKQDITKKPLGHYQWTLKQLYKPDPNRALHSFTIVDI